MVNRRYPASGVARASSPVTLSGRRTPPPPPSFSRIAVSASFSNGRMYVRTAPINGLPTGRKMRVVSNPVSFIYGKTSL